MESNLNPPKESKSEPTRHVILTRDIAVIGPNGFMGVITAGPLPDVDVVYVDQNGREAFRMKLW